MSVFDNDGFDDHEHVSFFAESGAGLRAIVAIHRTGPLGTAGGGCRMWPYVEERAAVRDALRLSRAMSYKLALVGIPSGGAKAVVIGDPRRDKSEALLLALGRAVERLGGRFVISEDVGTTPDDLAVVGRETHWVNPLRLDTADTTAYGVFVGIRTAVRLHLRREELRGLRVAVQGLGRVGRRLCHHLAAHGAQLFVSDLDERLVRAAQHELEAIAVRPDAIVEQEVDVLAPCALGDVLDVPTIRRLRCGVVAGSANNQLADSAAADMLAERGILYAPDIVVNAGGVLGAVGGDERTVRARVETIGPLLEQVIERARRDRISTQRAAEDLARERMRA
jgi:leucine dehydrogenase